MHRQTTSLSKATPVAGMAETIHRDFGTANSRKQLENMNV